MKYLIEPCCVRKHLLNLRNDIKSGRTVEFEGNGDMSLTELLPALLNRYCETELVIAAPSLPDQAAEAIEYAMRMQRARMDGKGKLDVVSHLTVIADLSEERSPMASAWLQENPFGERLTLVDAKQGETAILLPDIAIAGPVNLRYNRHFTATVTTEPEKVKALWEQYKPADTPAEEAEEPVVEDVPDEDVESPEEVGQSEVEDAPEEDTEDPAGPEKPRKKSKKKGLW